MNNPRSINTTGIAKLPHNWRLNFHKIYAEKAPKTIDDIILDN
jgi:hypothetical protein